MPIVDIITGGSPCQDLSVAGKRAGLDGERSGLFMEQIRIVKEMREHDRANKHSVQSIRPRYCIWENVPGAFSSNGGKDFQAVLTEFIKVAEPAAPDVPMPEKGRWPKCGFIYDEMGGWSVAWRVHDAQYWGVPQRRKRISVLADFNGLSAAEIMFDPQFERTTEDGEPISTIRNTGNEPRPEIPFECESVSRDSEQSGAARERVASGIEDSAGTASESAGNAETDTREVSGVQDSAICLQGNGIDRADTAGCNGRGWRQGGSYTLNTIDRPAVFAAGFDGNQGARAGSVGYEPDRGGTLEAGKIKTVLTIETG